MQTRTRIARWLRARAEWLWAPGLYALLAGILYHQIVVGQQGFGWDTIESYWGDLAFLSNHLGNGSWPLWNPYDRGGFPVYADPQPGAYYPLQWLFAAIGVLLGGVPWELIQLKMLAHHAIAGATMHLFARSRGLPRCAAIIGGLAWMGSAPMLVHKASNVLLPIVWAPLIWLMIDRLVQQPTWRRGCALAAGLYLAGSAGSPPGFFYTLLTALLYGCFRGAQALYRAYRQQPPALLGAAGRISLALATAALVTGLLLMITVVPALELTQHTGRAQRGLAYAQSLPLPVDKTLIALVQPTLGSAQSYPGVLVLMLALCGLVMRPLRDRGTPLFAALSAGVFLCLAFGPATPLLGWLVERVPGFGLFRIANRYKLIVAPMLALLAAFGAAELLRAPRAWTRERISAIAVSATVLVLAALAAWRVDAPAAPRSESAMLVLAALAAGLVTGAVIHTRRGAVVLAWAMAGFVLFDPDYVIHARGPVLERKPPVANAAQLRGLDGIATTWRIYDELVVEQRPGSRLSVRDFRGYPAGDPLQLTRYRDILEHARKHPEILEAYNIRYVLYGPHHRIGTRAHFLSRPPDVLAPTHFERMDARRYQARHPAPLALWYGAVRVSPDSRRDTVLDLVRQAEAADGQRRHAVLEPDAARALGSVRLAPLQATAGAPPPAVPAELIRYGLERIHLRVTAPASGLVVLNEIAYPGWRVTVDGRPATSVTANYALRAVPVDAGRHDIIWTFAPAGARLLLLLWAVGMAALVAAWLAPRMAKARDA